MQSDTIADDGLLAAITEMTHRNHLTRTVVMGPVDAPVMRDMMERIASAAFSDMGLSDIGHSAMDSSNVGPPRQMLDQLVRLQVHAQEVAYCAGFPGLVTCLIVHDGCFVGRYMLARRPGRLHLIDLALLPEMRGRGIGTDILTAIRALGRRAGVDSLTLSVAASNQAAQRLYERNGFCFDALDDGASATRAMTLWLTETASGTRS